MKIRVKEERQAAVRHQAEIAFREQEVHMLRERMEAEDWDRQSAWELQALMLEQDMERERLNREADKTE